MGLGLLAVLFAAAGILVMILWTAWGGVLLAGMVFALWMNTIVTKRQQAAIKKLLRQEPIYCQLLADYPDATVLWDVDAKGV
jgi:hypothetical protein